MVLRMKCVFDVGVMCGSRNSGSGHRRGICHTPCFEPSRSFRKSRCRTGRQGHFYRKLGRALEFWSSDSSFVGVAVVGDKLILREFDEIFFLRSGKTSSKIIVSAVYGAFSAGAAFEVVDIAGLDYVAAMFALNSVSSNYVFHGRVYYGKWSLSDDCVRGRICYIKNLIYCGDKINGCAAI